LTNPVLSFNSLVLHNNPPRLVSGFLFLFYD